MIPNYCDVINTEMGFYVGLRSSFNSRTTQSDSEQLYHFDSLFK
jgi:hypothetical protein